MSGTPDMEQDLFGANPMTPFNFLFQLGKLMAAAKGLPTEATKTNLRAFMLAYRLTQAARIAQGRQYDQNSHTSPDQPASNSQSALDIRHTTFGTNNIPFNPATTRVDMG